MKKHIITACERFIERKSEEYGKIKIAPKYYKNGVYHTNLFYFRNKLDIYGSCFYNPLLGEIQDWPEWHEFWHFDDNPKNRYYSTKEYDLGRWSAGGSWLCASGHGYVTIYYNVNGKILGGKLRTCSSDSVGRSCSPFDAELDYYISKLGDIIKHSHS